MTILNYIGELLNSKVKAKTHFFMTLAVFLDLSNSYFQGMRRMQLDGEKICMNVPFFHAFGMVMAVTGHLHAGTTIILENPTFNPIKSVETIIHEKCNVVFGTPTMWVRT